MKKIPTLEEIIEYRHLIKENTHSVITGIGIDELAMHREMTLRIFQVSMDDNTKQIAWKYCKNLAKYSHCPVAKTEYKRMQAYVHETGLIDVLLSALDGYLPDNENFILSGFDIVGFYYSIALISQSTYRRQECLDLLDKLANHAIMNLDNKGSLVLRNMKMLEKEYPDLAEFRIRLEEGA